MPAADDLLSTAQVAAMSGRSVRLVLRRIRTGELPATKLPGRTGAYVVKRADAERWAYTNSAA